MTDHENRPTDAPYGAEESAAILAAVSAGRDPTCPRCGGTLEHAPSIDKTSSGVRIYLVRCPTCRRAVFHAGRGGA